MPGFVARKIYKQTCDTREELGQSEETMYCLLCSLAVFLALFLGAGILSFWFPWAYNMFNLGSLAEYFSDMHFTAK